MRRTLAFSILIIALAIAASAVWAQAAETAGTYKVMGEVKKPGAYPVQGKTPLSAAIERAGGLTDQADWQHVAIKRTVDGKTETTVYDLRPIMYSRRVGAANTGALAPEGASGPQPGPYGYGGYGATVEDPLVLGGDVVVVPADPWAKPVTVEFSKTPLPTAIETLIKGSDFNYVIDPDLEQARVSAKLKDVPLRHALAQIVTAAGAIMFEQGGNTVGIKASSGTSAPPPPRATGATGSEPAPTTGKAEPRVTSIITLKYLSAGDVMPLLPATPDVRVTKSTDSAVVVTGGKQQVEELKQLVASLDKPEALPRAVRITLKAQVLVTHSAADAKAKLELSEAEIALKGATEARDILKKRTEAGLAPTEELRKAENTLQLAEVRYEAAKEKAKAGPAESRLSTQSIGLEGSQVQLDMSAGSDVQMRAVLVPVISTEPAEKGKQPGQTISLTGSGSIAGCQPFNFSKQFDVAASVKPGQDAVIASGSAYVPDGSLTFEVSVKAEIEPGRVKVAPGSQPNAGSGGFGGYGGGYGGR